MKAKSVKERVLGYLNGSPAGMTYNGILEVMGADTPDARGEVFTALKALTDDGMVRRSYADGKPTVFRSTGNDEKKKAPCTPKKKSPVPKKACRWCGGLYDPRGLMTHEKGCKENPAHAPKTTPPDTSLPPIPTYQTIPIIADAMADDPLPQKGQAAAAYGAKIWNNLKDSELKVIVEQQEFTYYNAQEARDKAKQLLDAGIVAIRIKWTAEGD